jgi:hypothetical protein
MQGISREIPLAVGLAFSDRSLSSLALPTLLFRAELDLFPLLRHSIAGGAERIHFWTLQHQSRELADAPIVGKQRLSAMVTSTHVPGWALWFCEECYNEDP